MLKRREKASSYDNSSYVYDSGHAHFFTAHGDIFLFTNRPTEWVATSQETLALSSVCQTVRLGQGGLFGTYQGGFTSPPSVLD